MNEQTLYIHKDLYAKFHSNSYLDRLKLNGYPNLEYYFDSLFDKLNDKYSFLNVTSIEEFTTKEDEKHFNTFSGYIEGDFGEFFEKVVISFTELNTKNGNTVVSQQFLPFISNELESDVAFFENNKILKIGILNAIITTTNKMENNKVKDVSSLQVQIQIMNTLGYEFIEMIKVKNLNPNKKFKTIYEYYNLSDYLRNQKQSNNQEVFATEKESEIEVRFRTDLKGQDFKFYGSHLLCIGKLANKKIVVINEKIYKSEKTIQAVMGYINYININELYNNDDVIEMQIISEEEKVKFDASGRKRYTRKPQKLFQKSIMKKYNNKCMCHDEKHNYFTCNTTNENYLELHHVLPFENQKYFMEEREIDLDVSENIIPLCPHCHRLLHHAIPAEKAKLLKDIYEVHEAELIKLDREISLFKFLEYYNVYII